MAMFQSGFLPLMAALIAFEAAARHASISRAAIELHLTQSAVSRRIKKLEEHVGVALFHRIRQRIVLTDAGRLYAADLRQTLDLLSTATHKVMALSGAGDILNIAVLPTFGTKWLIPRIPRFIQSNPQVSINFAARSEPFDFSLEPFDMAIHFGAPSWAGAQCERLFGEDVIPVCSPEYQIQHRVRKPSDLRRVTLLQQTTRPLLWAELCNQIGVDSSIALRGPHFEQFTMIAQATMCGLGVALLPRFLIEEELATKRLVTLFSSALTSEHAYFLVIPESRAENGLVKTFRDWLVSETSRFACEG